jgi:spermidine synthase
MRPWIELASAPVPGGKTLLKLMQRGEEYSIMLGTNELMNSRLSGSEEALARLVADRLGADHAGTILIGGLGMGFTLRAALLALSRAKIDVAEIVPEVIAWARGPLGPVFSGCLDNSRVWVINDDVAHLIKTSPATYDAILLDVDNGPDGVSREGNDGLYSHAGLAAALRALKPGGVLAVWSAHPSDAFARRLGQAGFAFDEIKVRARSTGKGARHVIWVATRKA